MPDSDVLVWFRNRFVPLRDANVNILTHALHYGTGVFEGIRGYWSEAENDLLLVRAEDHYRRWKANCGILMMDVRQSPAELADITAELVCRNQFQTNIYVRPLAWRSSPRIGVHPDDNFEIAIVAIPFGDYLDSHNGLHAGVVSWRRVQDNAIPGRAKICGAYVNSALASMEARLNGFDEAIFLSESGHVAEGATCNIFVVRGGRLITPSFSENILEGITRDSVMQLARRELGIEVVERPLERSELYVADEIFFTGTAVEVGPVTRVDHRRVGSGEIGPITEALRRLYFEAMRGRLPAWRQWVASAYQHALVAQ